MSTAVRTDKHELMSKLASNGYMPTVVDGDLVMLARPNEKHIKHDQAILCIVRVAGREQPSWLNYWGVSVPVNALPDDAKNALISVRNTDGTIASGATK